MRTSGPTRSRADGEGMESKARRPRRQVTADAGDALAPYADALRALLDAGELDGRAAPDLLAGLTLAAATRIALGDLDDLRHEAATRRVPADRWDGVHDDLVALLGVARARTPPPRRPT